MKKTLISIVVLSMAIISLALTACSDKKDSSSGSSATKEVSKKSEKSNGKANPESDFKVELNDDGTGIRILQYIGTSPNVITRNNSRDDSSWSKTIILYKWGMDGLKWK